jgi:hypothetical protein
VSLIKRPKDNFMQFNDQAVNKCKQKEYSRHLGIQQSTSILIVIIKEIEG